MSSFSGNFFEEHSAISDESVKNLDANSFLNVLGLILADPDNKKADYFQKKKTRIFYTP